MEQYHKNDGVCSMIGGGNNDYMQAVLQCLLRLQSFSLFFINQLYIEDGSESKLMEVCQLIRNIWSEANLDQTKIIQKMNLEASLFQLETFFTVTTEEDWNTKRNAAEFLDNLLQFIKAEIGLTKKKKNLS